MADSMLIMVDWLQQDDISFVAKNTITNHEVILDSQQVIGVKPMELLLMGLGGCASYDVVSILKKSKQQITEVRCRVYAERADTIPAVFTRICLDFIVKGYNVKASQVKKAIELSAKKYCSVSSMLENGGVEIYHDFKILEEI